MHLRTVAVLASCGTAAACGALLLVLDDDIRRSDQFTVLDRPGLTVDDAADPGAAPPAATSVENTLNVGSPPVEGAPESAASAGAVVISEVMYHPAEGSPIGEFVEITNTGDVTVDVGQWCVRGLRACIDDGALLEPGESLVVTAGAGTLSNRGERLRLLNSRGDMVDAVEYGTVDPWPAEADGTGPSLQRRDLNASAQNSGNWDARPATPGERNADLPVRPSWVDVSFTRSPAAVEPIRVQATIIGVDSARARVYFRFGFGDEQMEPVIVEPDGTIDAQIPGGTSGELVRIRLEAEAESGSVGHWPRSDDDRRYGGTTVREADDDPDVATDLLRVQWFMEQSTYDAAFGDLELYGDNGYPAVVAIGGQVVDGALVRVKGGSARGFPKPKWKFTLPPGETLRIDAAFTGSVDLVVDEFALHSSWNDKSQIREVLSHEAFRDVGLPVAAAFPVQVELNGDFYGLFTYVEQSDGAWRQRVDLDDAAVWEVGAFASATFAADEAAYSDGDFAFRYQRENGEAQDDTRLRALITDLHSFDDDVDARREWVFANLDVPAFLDTLAVSYLIQSTDFSTKNFRLALRPDGRFTVVPFDLEYTWGRDWTSECEWACEDVSLLPLGPNTSPALFAPFASDPILANMLDVRIRSLGPHVIDVERLDRRLDALRSSIGDEAERDRDRWGTYGVPQTVSDAIDELRESYLIPRSAALSPPPAPPTAGEVSMRTETAGASIVRLTNVSDRYVDLSGSRIEPSEITIRGGVVLAPGASAIVSNSESAATDPCCIAAGSFTSDDELRRNLDLIGADGTLLATT